MKYVYLFAAFFFAVLLTGSIYLYWNSYNDSISANVTEQYLNDLDDLYNETEGEKSESSKEALKRIVAISKDINNKLSPIATIHLTNYYIKEDQPEKIKDLYQMLLNKANIHKKSLTEWEEVILIASTDYHIKNDQLEKINLDLMKYIARDDGPWRFFAQEQLVYYFLHSSNQTESITYIKSLSKNQEAPIQIQMRMTKLLSILENNAKFEFVNIAE